MISLAIKSSKCFRSYQMLRVHRNHLSTISSYSSLINPPIYFPLVNFHVFQISKTTMVIDKSNLIDSESPLILSELRDLNQYDLSIISSDVAISLLFQFARKRIYISRYLNLLQAIRQSISSRREKLTKTEISSVFFGLQCLSDRKNELVLSVYREIAILLSHDFNQQIELDSKSLGCACYGLHYFTGNYEEEKLLLLQLSNLILKSKCIDLTSFTISSICFGK